LDFSKHIQKAEEAARRRNYDYAVELYQQLLELDPDQGEARAGLRRVLRKRYEQQKPGRFKKVLSGAGPLTLAKGLRKAGRTTACIKALEQYLATNPMDVDANLMLGEVLETGQHFKSARAVYEFLAEIAPRNPAGLKRAGAMMAATGDPLKALEYYERALEADPRDQESIKARKDLSAEAALRKTSDAKVQHSREQIKDKEQAREIERSQRLHRSEEELREDLAKLEDRLAESPSDPDLLVRIANLHERLNDFEAALELIERACEYRRGSFDLLQSRAELRAKVMKKRLSRADKDGDAELAGRLEDELRKSQVEDLQELVKLRPGDAALRLRYARMLLRLDEVDAALAELQKAVEDPRQQAEASFCLGQAFQRKGFRDLARKHFERALEGATRLDERGKEVLYALGAIAEEEGRNDEARGFYARIFEVDIGYRDVAEKMEQFKP
jgi:tetratricopeptide (TPR) repeat protein